MGKGFIEIDVQDWSRLNERIASLETNMEQLLTNHLKHIEAEMQWIKERLSKGYRPPWSVVVVITFLTSICVGLIVNAFK